jgi:DNA repair protein RecN (Recombination protein N)
MLASLSIRELILVDKLDLQFEPGLSVLTGETGAGKSILLDALGLAIGVRAESGMVRRGAKKSSVTAMFEPNADHSVWDLLKERDIDCEDCEVVLRRVINEEGRSRAYINEQPVSVSLLRTVGQSLAEIQGQFEQHGLLNTSTHRELLDAYGGTTDLAKMTAVAWNKFLDARSTLQGAEAAIEQAEKEEDFLKHSTEELEKLAPEDGEEQKLVEQRVMLMNVEKVSEAIATASALLTENGSASDKIGEAQRVLDRANEKAPGSFEKAIEALDRVSVELDTAVSELLTVSDSADVAPGLLEEIEDRLYALRDVARKHRVTTDELPKLTRDFRGKLDSISDQGRQLDKLKSDLEKAKSEFSTKADQLSGKRAKAAERLAQGVNKELPELKLDLARLMVSIESVEEDQWSANGKEKVQFLARTNPGANFAPLAKVASGGELSRFLLALKVTLSATSPVPTLVFDEVDSGVGGATAAAIGERLSRLGEDLQVLVITHSPQVAAKGRYHFQVKKSGSDQEVTTSVSELEEQLRLEEIARMISGAEITPEARAAASRLIEAS